MNRDEVRSRIIDAVDTWGKELPEGGDVSDDQLDDLDTDLTAAIDEVRDSESDEDGD
jgi:hypothetical protein